MDELVTACNDFVGWFLTFGENNADKLRAWLGTSHIKHAPQCVG